MDGELYVMGLGGLISVLLSLSAYLLHYLVQDIREMKTGLAGLKTDCAGLKADSKALHALMQAHLSTLRSKVNRMEKQKHLNS